MAGENDFVARLQAEVVGPVMAGRGSAGPGAALAEAVRKNVRVTSGEVDGLVSEAFPVDAVFESVVAGAVGAGERIAVAGFKALEDAKGKS